MKGKGIDYSKFGSPCANCENKGCGSYHDKCEKYLAYKKEMDDFKNIRREIREYSTGYGKEKRARIDKMLKNKRGR